MVHPAVIIVGQAIRKRDVLCHQVQPGLRLPINYNKQPPEVRVPSGTLTSPVQINNFNGYINHAKSTISGHFNS